MSSGHLLVLAASIMWILFCMRFWYIIDRDQVWQRHLIAIAAGLGGGLIYFVGMMLVQALKEPPPAAARATCRGEGRQRHPGVSTHQGRGGEEVGGGPHSRVAPLLCIECSWKEQRD